MGACGCNKVKVIPCVSPERTKTLKSLREALLDVKRYEEAPVLTLSTSHLYAKRMQRWSSGSLREIHLSVESQP